MATHVSEAEAITSMALLLARVDAGEEIVIERKSGGFAVLKPAGGQRAQMAPEVTTSEKPAKERNDSPVMDDEFAADLEEIIAMRKLQATSWPMARSLAEVLAIARHYEHQVGRAPFPDSEFANDVEEGIRNRQAWNPPDWD